MNQYDPRSKRLGKENLLIYGKLIVIYASIQKIEGNVLNFKVHLCKFIVYIVRIKFWDTKAMMRG